METDNYKAIKDKRTKDTNDLFTNLGVFWAFSNEQFAEGYAKVKPTMAEGEKLVDIGAGGYIPKHNVEALIQGNKDIATVFKNSIKECKAREQHILYELNNHECFYSGSVENCIDALGDDYTFTEVQEVYKKFKAKRFINNTNQQEKYA